MDQPDGLRALRDMRRRAARIAQKAATKAELWREEPIYRSLVRRRLFAPYYRRRFHHFGEGSLLERPMWLYGPEHMSIGPYSIILRGAWLAVERVAWDNPEPTVVLGARFGARPFVTISAAASIVVEDNVGMGSFSTIIDSDHTWDGGSDNVLDNPLKARPIHIGEGTFIAERVAILAGARLGKRCFIGANTVVNRDYPDYAIVVGVPGRVVGSTRPESDQPQ